MNRTTIPRGLPCLSALIAVLLAGGCGASADADDDVVDDDVGSVQDALNQPNSWGTAPSHDIDVCWRPSDFKASNLVTLRRNVRSWVEQHIGRVTDLRFHGWGQCPPPDASVYIQIQTGTGSSMGGYQDGTDADGFQSSGKTQIHLGSNGVGTLSGGQRQGVQFVVLHEFLHALGFGHEFNRTENASAKDCHWQGEEPGDGFGTPYDPLSIMNRGYCAGPPTLSAWDVVGLQRAYGIKPYLSLVGVSNKCVDIENPSMSPPMSSTRLQAYECGGDNVNQVWFANPATSPPSFNFVSLSHALNGGTHVVMDVGGGSANGTPIVNSPFTNGADQQWRLDGIEIVGMGDMCLDAPSFAGGVPRLLACNGGSNQKWDIFRNPAGNDGTYIRSTAAPNVCLTRNGANGLALRTCEYTANPQPASQRFSFAFGHISADSSSCLDVLWATPSQGQTVQAIPCRANDGSDQLNDAQRWYFRGPIHGLDNKCLDVISPSGAVVENGTKVALWDCNGGLNQRFDFHF